jgi:hypothetical protein
MKGLHLEQNAVVNECYAVVYAPGKNRKRFSENVVYVKASEQEARRRRPGKKSLPGHRHRPGALLRRFPSVLPAHLAGVTRPA